MDYRSEGSNRKLGKIRKWKSTNTLPLTSTRRRPQDDISVPVFALNSRQLPLCCKPGMAAQNTYNGVLHYKGVLKYNGVLKLMSLRFWLISMLLLQMYCIGGFDRALEMYWDSTSSLTMTVGMYLFNYYGVLHNGC
jgi:hypothetical protein